MTVFGACTITTSYISACSANCLVCQSQTPSPKCLVCSYGYTMLVNQTCTTMFPHLPPNCMYAFYYGKPSMCQLCLPNYAVSPTYLCVPYFQGSCSISNCQYCNINGTCVNCTLGYVLSANQYSCIAIACGSISACISCLSPTSCSQCKTGYTPINNGSHCVQISYGCTIANC